MTFYVIHAVSGTELAKTKELCDPPKGDLLWANPKDETLDVYVTVGSNRYTDVEISGLFIIDRP